MNIVEGNLLSIFLQAIIFIFNAYIIILLIRFLFQKIRVSWYNPISQFVVKLTEKPLKPFRKIIPGVAGFDLAILVFAFLVQLIESAVFYGWFGGKMLQIAGILLISLTGILSKFMSIYFYGIIIGAIASWIPSLQNHPAMEAVYLVTEPLLSRIRRIAPRIASIDISPLFAIFGLMLLNAILISPLNMFGLNLALHGL